MSSKPWAKWYFSDWRADPLLRMCSGAARGLWIEMLALMHEAGDRGNLVVNSKPPTVEALAKLVGLPLEETQKSLEELESNGVFSRRKNEIIYSRRMDKDEIKASKNRENGKLGGNPSLSKDKDNLYSDNPPDKPEVKAHGSLPEARDQKPEEERGSSSKDDWQGLELKLREAAGWQREAHPNLCIVGPIVQLISTGASLELDVLPVIRARGPGLSGRTSWNYFIKPIQEAMAKRLGVKSVSDVPVEKWVVRLTWARMNGQWGAVWGPPPHQPGCQVPPHLVVPEDGEGWTEWKASA